MSCYDDSIHASLEWEITTNRIIHVHGNMTNTLSL